MKKLLTEQGIEFDAINHLEHPLTADILKKLLRSAKLKPGDALRSNEPAYKQHVAGRDLTDEQLINLMVKHQELIQRPIVVKGNKAVLARPSDKLKELGL